MNAAHQLLTDQLGIWTAAEATKKSGRGRSSGNGASVYGVKKLRELILQLAAMGKLVPQNPNDEPASELLKRIQAEKAKLIAEGKIKKGKPLSSISDDEKPFLLPQGWELVRLGVITEKLTDGSHNPPRDAGYGLPMLSSQNVNFGKIDFDSPSRFVSAEDFESENSRTKIEPNDILLTIVGSLGRSAVVPRDAPKFVLQRSVAVIKTELFSDFLCIQLVAPFCMNYYEMHGKGTAQKGIYLGQLSEIPIAVPPLSEQHRIVAKVDELMALCDQLEAQHTSAAEAHEKLVSHLLGTLTQSQNEDDFSANWQRIAAYFDTLFTTESSIDALKQTLLQLAVMGKLVPQDPGDEPAGELLKRIQAEKAKLIAEGKIKKGKPLPPITDEEKPFELPLGWAWVRLGGVIEVSSSKRIHVNDYVSEGVPFFRSKEIGELQRGESISTDLYISKEKYNGLRDLAGFPKVNDLMLTSVGSIGNTWLADGREFYYKDGNITKLGGTNLLVMLFVQNFIASPLFGYQVTDTVSGTAYNALTIVKLNALVFPLPPLNEQRRIVAKVDELMALCDQLKTRITEVNQLQQKLANVVVEQAVLQ